MKRIGDLDIPVTPKSNPGPTPEPSAERMIWVDTVYVDAVATAQAVCVTKDGQVKMFKIDDLHVVEDSKPRLLLNPKKLQEALRKRMGNQPVIMPPGGMQMRDMSVQRIPAENIGPGMFRSLGNKPPPSNEGNPDGEEKET